MGVDSVTLRPTLAELAAGLMLATGAKHVVALPPQVVRVRLTGMLFETDKSFLLPSSMPGIRRLKEIYDERPTLNVLVSGHADRAGSDAHNLTLSVERAQAVAAFLKDVVDDWLPRYGASGHTGAQWGVREDQFMLSAVTDGAGAPYFAGPVTGTSGPATRDAVKRFQADAGLPSGPIDSATRKELITRYMATDGTTLPAGATLTVHGCGEFHPSVATANSVALAENRRVELFFFRGPVTPPPVNPCPNGGCAEYPQWVAHSIRTVDVNSSPEIAVHLVDELGLPLKNAKLQLVLPDGKTEDVSTDGDGVVRPRVPPGSSFDVVVKDVHEGGVGDSLTTPSGHHFPADFHAATT
jgi:outer membrane protein OmpA-like peptidoglycan-associated protein